MGKMIIGIIAGIIITGYAIALTNNLILFIVYLNIARWALVVTAIFAICFWAAKKMHKERKMQYRISVLLCIVFSLALAINSYVVYPIFHGLNIKMLQPSSAERVQSLAYLTWATADNLKERGVTKYDPKRSFSGINMYCDAQGKDIVRLIDMSGKLLHSWSTEKITSSYYARLRRNGDLLLIDVGDHALSCLDWNSNIKWTQRMNVNHEMDIAANGDVYVLSRKEAIPFFYGLPLPMFNDYIVILSPSGKVKREISLFKVLKKQIPFSTLVRTYSKYLDPDYLRKRFGVKKKMTATYPLLDPEDILHANTVKIIDKDIAGVCKKGDLLISARSLDLVGVMNPAEEKLVWRWGPGDISKQHSPSLLKNGNILIFDNGFDKGFSRVIELNPVTGKIVWEYKSDPADAFYTSTAGACQRLPNGNTLITESNKGHVFEVTKGGRIVWEFYNPNINSNDRTRKTIYCMTRITDPEHYPCLQDISSKRSP